MPRSTSSPEIGTLLLAPPMLRDPNFRRAVVLVCEHGTEGSFGLVLNRPLDVRLGEVLEHLEGYADPLSLGGPVQPDTLHFLHRYGEEVPGAIPVVGDVCWGGSFEAVKALVHAGAATTAQTLRFFLGYAGWIPGQLEEEIAGDGWILASPEADAVFPEDPARLWRRVLRRMGGDYALLANFPDDPRMN